MDTGEATVSEKTLSDKDFPYGSDWVRADFHLHTKADKEFKYPGKENDFVNSYVEALKAAGIRLGVITNHNKFDADEFRALRKRARKEGIGLLSGVELSVKDGANGVHALIVFSDEWIADGKDYINPFLTGPVSAPARSGLGRCHPRASPRSTDVHVLGLQAKPLGAECRPADRSSVAEQRGCKALG